MRTILLINGLALAASLVLGSAAAAVPFEYRVTMTSVPEPGKTPALNGAIIEVTYNHDLADAFKIGDGPALPYLEWRTSWSASTTTASVRVSGSGANNGVYRANVWNSWDYLDHASLADFGFPGAEGFADIVAMPTVEFRLDDFSIVSIGRINARLDETFHQGHSTIYPRAFTTSEASWSDPFITVQFTADQRSLGTILSGFARSIPEPSSCTISALTLFAHAVIRRRRS